MQLTREQFQKALKTLATKKDLEVLTTKGYLRKAIEPLATKKDVRNVVEELARITNSGFEDVLGRLDVRERVAIMKKKFHKIEEALHIKL